MSSFWERKLGGPAPTPRMPDPQAVPSRAPRAWWQDPEPEYVPPSNPRGALEAQMPYSGRTAGSGQPEDAYMRELSRVPTENLSQEQMEALAEWEMRTKERYNTHCPQCGSGNFVHAGDPVTMPGTGYRKWPTDRCFNCGYGPDGAPMPSPGGSSAGGRSGTAARQIDAGGGAGASNYISGGGGLPAQYVPRVR